MKRYSTFSIVCPIVFCFGPLWRILELHAILSPFDCTKHLQVSRSIIIRFSSGYIRFHAPFQALELQIACQENEYNILCFQIGYFGLEKEIGLAERDGQYRRK